MLQICNLQEFLHGSAITSLKEAIRHPQQKKSLFKQTKIRMERESALVKIPPELRNRIYRFATLHARPIDVTGTTKKKESALLATCEQIREEALQMFYHENVFYCRLEMKLVEHPDQDVEAGFQRAVMSKTARPLPSFEGRKKNGNHANRFYRESETPLLLDHSSWCSGGFLDYRLPYPNRN